ncbi:MAG: glucuronyl esterase domain-containing protein [Promethearchaeota archaeon]
MQLVKEFPDPFLFNDGTRVKTKEEWNKRREEIKKLILEIEYGMIPDAPEDMNVEIINSVDIDEAKYYEELKFTFIPSKNNPDISFEMNASIRYPIPECIENKKESIPNFGENGLPCMIYIGNTAQLELFDNGYITICFQNDQLEPMEMGNPIIGPAKSAYEKLEPGKYSWGSIAVWAWGASRVLDYALTRDDINKDQIIISGHSRNGKAALLAGALDERFALVNPAGSGCAGAGSFLAIGEGAETLAYLTDRRRWWAWIHEDFENYAYEFRGESKKKLPFDQHFVMALVAPRPLLRTEGSEDWWANPEGTCCAFLATEPVYEFLGVPERNQCFIRPGGHFQGHEDMMALVSFADWYFFGKKQERVFKDLVYEKGKFPTLFKWTKPD